jgi:hypothetical protein
MQIERPEIAVLICFGYIEFISSVKSYGSKQLADPGRILSHFPEENSLYFLGRRYVGTT